MDSVSQTTKQQVFEGEALRYMDALYHFGYSLTGNRDDAQDLLQETYLKAYRFWDHFRPGTNCKAWLFQIMKNSFINRYRKTHRDPGMVSYDEVEEFYDSIKSSSVPSANNVQKIIFEDVFDDDISSALQSLPETFRTVLVLSDVESFTYEEIAEVVGCPIGTVRSRLHRARKLMQTQLRAYAQAKGYDVSEQSDSTA
jgi:RNA polymerase sigma-70 factor, ECF subfamily